MAPATAPHLAMPPPPTSDQARAAVSEKELEQLRSEMITDCRRALVKIRDLVESRPAEVLDTGRKAWGQWLNDPNYMPDQWGRYGSSAGVQVMAATQWLTATNVRWDQTTLCRQLAPELFPEVLPSIPDLDEDEPEHREVQPGDDDPYKARDFAQPLKVAFCIDALFPDEQEVRRDHALVDLLVRHRLPEKACWTTRLDNDPKRAEADLHLVTAFALFSLRRFPDAQGLPRVAEAYRWLAVHVRDQLGVNVVALSGLALLGATGPLRTDPELRSALEYCDRTLLGWAREHPEPIIERPWVASYVEGRHTIYVFLSPEIVIALYFLQRKLAGDALHYIWTVVDGVVRNVLRDGAGGLRVQDGLEGTVDQLWACRLLLAFTARFESDDLLPVPRTDASLPAPPLGALRRNWRPIQAMVAAFTAVGGYAALTAADAPAWLTIPGAVAAALGATMIGIVVKPWFSRVAGREDEGRGR